MSPIVEEIRRAYAAVGITLDAPATPISTRRGSWAAPAGIRAGARAGRARRARARTRRRGGAPTSGRSSGRRTPGATRSRSSPARSSVPRTGSPRASGRATRASSVSWRPASTSPRRSPRGRRRSSSRRSTWRRSSSTASCSTAWRSASSARRESSYEPLRKIAATVERDELGHSEMGHYFLAEIASDRKGKALCQHLLGKWYPAALDMFGRSDSRNAPKFIRWGLKSVGNAEIREAYTQYVDRKLEALGLEPPDERLNRRFL